MQLGRVVGRITASAKLATLEGQKLLLVQPLDAGLQPNGRIIVCTDATGSGAGELVYWVRGREATIPFRPNEVVSDATIVGVVDEIDARGARSC
jgi:ethanolamine utilization protein EutN